MLCTGLLHQHVTLFWGCRNQDSNSRRSRVTANLGVDFLFKVIRRHTPHKADVLNIYMHITCHARLRCRTLLWSEVFQLRPALRYHSRTLAIPTIYKATPFGSWICVESGFAFCLGQSKENSEQNVPDSALLLIRSMIQQVVRSH